MAIELIEKSEEQLDWDLTEYDDNVIESEYFIKLIVTKLNEVIQAVNDLGAE